MSNQATFSDPADVAFSDPTDVVFDALGDATRRRIVQCLRSGPLPVGELAAGLPVGRPAVSKHLKVLEGAGLVEHHSVGTRNLYALAPPGFAALQQWLVGTWDAAAEEDTSVVDGVFEVQVRPWVVVMSGSSLA
jgi:DNA-binding transcriptional ArsR family regulator